MKKVISLILASCLVLSVFAACSKKDTDSSSDDASNSAAYDVAAVAENPAVYDPAVIAVDGAMAAAGRRRHGQAGHIAVGEDRAPHVAVLAELADDVASGRVLSGLDGRLVEVGSDQREAGDETRMADDEDAVVQVGLHERRRLRTVRRHDSHAVVDQQLVRQAEIVAVGVKLGRVIGLDDDIPAQVFLDFLS